jgi:CBS domain-containing protein
MTCDVVVMTAETDVAEVARRMLGQRLRAIPIVQHDPSGDRLVGIITRRDLMRCIGREDALVAADVRHRLQIYRGPGRWTVDARAGRVTITDEYDNPDDRHVAHVLAAAGARRLVGAGDLPRAAPQPTSGRRPGEGDAMKLDELVTTARDALQVRRVFAEPVERNGATVIAAATVAGAAGGGHGEDDHGQEGAGGGFGLTARPAGVYVIKDGTVRWIPAVDVNRLLRTLGAVAIVFLITRSRIARARLKAGGASGA